MLVFIISYVYNKKINVYYVKGLLRMDGPFIEKNKKY